MFGVPRKKTKPAKIRAVAASSSDEDENDDARRRLQEHQRRKTKDKKDKKKKKKKAGPMLSFDPEEGGGDGDDGGEVQRKKSKKRKKHSKHKSKRSGSGGRMGYGGLGTMAMNASDDESSSDGEKKEGDGGGNYYDIAALQKLRSEQKLTTLVKEDSIKVEPTKSPTEEIISQEAIDDDKEVSEEEGFISLSGGKTKHTKSSRVVLTGDEAMAYAQREDGENNEEFDHGLHSPPTPPSLGGTTNDKTVAGKIAGMDINADAMDVDEPSEDVDEGNKQWEDTMARRAGVLPPNAAAGNREQSRTRQQRENNSSSLSQIRTSLQPTISNLENIYSDLETSIHRHESTLSSTHNDLTNHKKTLQKHGQALEYYQGLREDLATWMGALRELNAMVTKVEEAKGKLEEEMSWRRMERFWEWGRDCTDVLAKRGLLKNKIVGEDNGGPEGIDNVPAQVDEFGRDMSSMASIARVKRWNDRRKRSMNRLQGAQTDNCPEDSVQEGHECSNADNLDSKEIEEWNQRQEALTQAITIIPNLVKDDYLSISNLCTLFADWNRLYPDDYASCYAQMSLVQMISVLVRLEMCEHSSLHAQPSSNLCVGITKLNWFCDLKKEQSRSDAISDAGKTSGKNEPRGQQILSEVVQKQIVGGLLDTFSFEDGHKSSTKKHGVYDPFSVTQTKSLCSMLESVLDFLSKSSNGNICAETVEKLSKALLSSTKYCVGKMTIPFIDSSKITMSENGNGYTAKDGTGVFDSEVADAIVYATAVQAKALGTLVQNIVRHWYPIHNQWQPDKAASFVQFVLMDLLSFRILPLLQSLHCITSGSKWKYSELPKLLIHDILNSMEGSGLLDKDEWMMMAAPLRVAAKQWDDK